LRLSIQENIKRSEYLDDLTYSELYAALAPLRNVHDLPISKRYVTTGVSYFNKKLRYGLKYCYCHSPWDCLLYVV